jgi:hypothetical protein
MARDAILEKYLARTESYFKGFTIEYVKRTKTKKQMN